MDSYFKGINDCPTVTRMVNGSVMKGMVNADKEEGAEKIAALEAEFVSLNNRLRLYLLDVDKDQEFGSSAVSIDTKKTESDVSSYEQNWEREFQEEVNAIVFRSVVSVLQEEFEEKLRDERRHWLDSQYKKWVTKFDELSSLRQELDVISKSLSGHELGAGASHESVEWASHLKVLGNLLSKSTILQQENGKSIMESGKSKESKNAKTKIMESAQLMDMTKEDLISYFQTEIVNMKRIHESDLQRITEDYYKFRREFLKESGSSPWRKDKEFDTLRKKIPEIILKLDDILIENEKLRMGCVEYENLCGLRDRVDNLSSENQQLWDLLMYKRKVVKSLKSQVSDATDQMLHHSLAEANFIKQIQRLKCDVEDANIGIFVREEIYKSVFKELIGRIKCDVENSDAKTIIVQEMSGIIVREVVKDAKATINMIKMKHNQEKEQRIYLESVLLENEKTLCLEIKEKEQLKEEKMSLMELVEQREKLALEAKSTLIKQEEQFKLISQELNMLREEQARLVAENKRELDSIRSRLDDVDNSNNETIIVHEMSGIIFREVVKDAEATINMIKMKHNQEKEQRICLESVLLENEKILRLEIKEKEQLKEEKMSLLELVEEREKLALEAKSTLVKQEEQFKLICQELNMLRKEQARLVVANKREQDSIRSRLDEAFETAGLYEVEISKLDQKVKVAVDKLRESERRRSTLYGIIQEKEHIISLVVAIEREQRNQIGSILIYIKKLSKLMIDFECKVEEDVKRNNSRLEMLNYQSNPLIQQANLLGKKCFEYKQRLERRCSDLQKAEAEVDLLGDKVDALISLLEKIHIALDHYSPIFQHYYGVMEILQLVRRELIGYGDSTKPV